MSILGPESSPESAYFGADTLLSFVARLFEASGLEAKAAGTAAKILVDADLRGVWSHGVARVPMYRARVRSGAAKARPAIRIERVAPTAALVDGDDGLGLVVAPRAMAEAVAIARDGGIGLVGVRRSGHFGTSSYYLTQATEAGCIGMSFTTSSPALPPAGAAGRLLGTSPFGFAAPTTGERTFLIDMAMSRVARGKLKFAAQRGEAIPPGYALDSSGHPTTDGKAAFDGTMLPFGEHKGAALSWMMDVFAGVFTGAGFGGDVGNPFLDLNRPQGAGHVFIAIRADLFCPSKAFAEGMADMDRRAKALPKADGVEQIMAPGEPEARKERFYRERGVPLPPDVVAGLQAEAIDAGIAWPF